MDMIEALETRRSVRRYQDKTVDQPVIEKLISLATHAPSAMNSQPWVFVVITDKNKLVEYSTRSKALLLQTMNEHPLLEKYRGALSKKAFIFFTTPRRWQ